MKILNLIILLVFTVSTLTSCTKKREDQKFSNEIKEASNSMIFGYYAAAIHVLPMHSKVDFNLIVPKHRLEVFNKFTNHVQQNMKTLTNKSQSKEEVADRIQGFVLNFVKTNDEKLTEFLDNLGDKIYEKCHADKANQTKCMNEFLVSDSSKEQLESYRFFAVPALKKALQGK